MDISSVQNLCIHLISSAYQRCRLSEDLCRLSVVLERDLAPPIIRVSISDTGTGSCLYEFQDLKYSREGIGTENWGKWMMMIGCFLSKLRVIVYPGQCKYQPDRHLIKKAVKLALDDFKGKYTGFLLSVHAAKICSYAPDLASSIAGIILSSNDSEFQSKCASLLGLLQSQETGRQTVEDCIKGKIVSIIETNYKKPKKTKEAAPLLIEDDRPHDPEPIPFSEDDEGGDDVFSFSD